MKTYISVVVEGRSKAEERVAKTGRIYNEACEELQKLREKKAAIENEALVAAFMKSNKSLEEAIAFFESEMVEKDEELKPKRRGGRRKNQNKKPQISSGFMSKMIFEWKNIRKLTKWLFFEKEPSDVFVAGSGVSSNHP